MTRNSQPISERMTSATRLTRSGIQANVDALVDEWSAQRHDRQLRRSLDVRDFGCLRDAGYLEACLPTEVGGLWQGDWESRLFVLELLRRLAHADSSVALVAAMHPLVLATAGWLATAEVPAPDQKAWAAQQRWVFDTVRDGAWWGTITSEPGTGGDQSKSRAVARPTAGAPGCANYRLSGQKHFGSGFGMASFMITTAIAEGECEPDIFFMDLRNVPTDGSAGVRVVAEWDGHGMTATQSHAAEFTEFPVTRLAWPVQTRKFAGPVRGFGSAFATVIVGIVEIAVETARSQLQGRRGSMSAFEQTEWSRVEVDSWLIQQAYAGLRTAMRDPSGRERDGLLGKVAIADLAESTLSRLCRVIGGGAFSRHSPYGFWFEDVRALGFLRPPWSLGYDRTFAGSWATEEH